MTKQEFKIKKQGNYFVAFDTEDKTKSYGKINIKTGQCIGGTLCFEALRKHWELIVNKEEESLDILCDKVLEQIKVDVNTGDLTAIDELIRFLPRKRLEGFLSTI